MQTDVPTGLRTSAISHAPYSALVSRGPLDVPWPGGQLMISTASVRPPPPRDAAFVTQKAATKSAAADQATFAATGDDPCNPAAIVTATVGARVVSGVVEAINIGSSSDIPRLTGVVENGVNVETGAVSSGTSDASNLPNPIKVMVTAHAATFPAAAPTWTVTGPSQQPVNDACNPPQDFSEASDNINGGNAVCALCAEAVAAARTSGCVGASAVSAAAEIVERLAWLAADPLGQERLVRCGAIEDLAALLVPQAKQQQHQQTQQLPPPPPPPPGPVEAAQGRRARVTLGSGQEPGIMDASVVCWVLQVCADFERVRRVHPNTCSTLGTESSATGSNCT